MTDAEFLEFLSRLESSEVEERVEAIPILLKALENEPLSGRAARALGRIGPDARQAVPLIARLLESPTISRRRVAAEALGQIGPAAVDALPLLLKTFQDRAFFEQIHRPCERYPAAEQPPADQPGFREMLRL